MPQQVSSQLLKLAVVLDIAMPESESEFAEPEPEPERPQPKYVKREIERFFKAVEKLIARHPFPQSGCEVCYIRAFRPRRRWLQRYMDLCPVARTHP